MWLRAGCRMLRMLISVVLCADHGMYCAHSVCALRSATGCFRVAGPRRLRSRKRRVGVICVPRKPDEGRAGYVERNDVLHKMELKRLARSY